MADESDEWPLVNAVKAACPDSMPGIQRLLQSAAGPTTDWQAYLEEEKERSRQFAAALTESSSAYDLLTAAFLDSADGRRIELAARALASAPEDGRILLGAVVLCMQMDIATCDSSKWLLRLLELDPENSEAWALAALDAARREDLDKAQRLLKQAAAVSETRSYWPDLVEIMHRGLSTTGELSFSESVYKAFDLGLRGLPNYSAIFHMCRENAEQDTEWARTCLEYGRGASARNDNVLGEQIQRSIELNALRTLGQETEALAVEAMLEARRKEHAELAEYPGTELIALIPDIFDAYLDDARQAGETVAMQRVNENAHRLLTDTPEVFCAYIDSFILASAAGDGG